MQHPVQGVHFLKNQQNESFSLTHPQIYIWQLKDNDLIGIAFIDTQVYTHQILTIKNLILIADVYQSISLLRFQDEYRTLSLVSRVSRLPGNVAALFNCPV